MDCGKDWSREDIEIMLKRGPHWQSNGKKAVRQIHQDTEDKVKHKYEIIVKWGDTKNEIPRKIKKSPVEMIPHKSKPFIFIMDISFILFHKGVKFLSVN